jgi:hypothetical protein
MKTPEVWSVSVDAYVLYDAVWALYSIHSVFNVQTLYYSPKGSPIVRPTLPDPFQKPSISSSVVTKFVEIGDRARWSMSIPAA